MENIRKKRGVKPGMRVAEKQRYIEMRDISSNQVVMTFTTYREAWEWIKENSRKNYRTPLTSFTDAIKRSSALGCTNFGYRWVVDNTNVLRNVSRETYEKGDE